MHAHIVATILTTAPRLTTATRPAPRCYGEKRIIVLLRGGTRALALWEIEMAEAEPKKTGFTIFRAKDAPALMQSGAMSIAPITDIQREGLTSAVRAGYTEGDDIQILVDLPAFSLAHAWLKKNYPLALHTHDSDCLYYIVAGSLKLGTEELGARDSFFVPAGVPYTYRPGPDGVEVLEFRHETQFSFVNLSKTAAFWDKATQTVRDNLDDWKEAKRPSEVS